ncbi:MAG: DUF4397 domain-containing protein [Nocardioides sp.]
MKVVVAGIVGALFLVLLLTPPGTRAATGAAQAGTVTVVQAVPGRTVVVRVDGKPVQGAAEVGEFLGPLRLPAGSHKVSFTDDAGDVDVTSTLRVKAGSTSDVVLHRPASVGGAPVVSSYGTPTEPIGPGKARVLVAHTATVAPADVRVDGQVVFTNIANGEFATADVPAGTHVVELLPTGTTTDPILGPLDLTVAAGTVSMVYAVGNPRDRSMQVILHSGQLRDDGTVVPDTIRTGSAGLLAGLRVRQFGP